MQSSNPPTNFASGGDPGGVHNNYLVSAAKSAASGTWRRLKQHPFSAAGSTVVICLTLYQTITPSVQHIDQRRQMQIVILDNFNEPLTATKYKDLTFPVDEEKLGESMEEVYDSVLHNDSNINSLDKLVEEGYKIMELAIEEDPEAAKAALSPPDSTASPENENELKSREQFKAKLQKVARRVGGARTKPARVPKYDTSLESKEY